MPSPSDLEPARRRPWRWIAVAATVGVVSAAGITYASASTTAAAPLVRFSKVYYNSPGTDTRSNASLNAEYVQVTNRGRTAVSVAGWTVKDAAGHTYKLSGTLAAGATVVIHTGKGTNGKPAKHVYWGSGNYIWNNTGDTATLRTRAGAVVHTCRWGSTGSVTLCAAPAPVPPKTTAPTVTPTTVPTMSPTTVPPQTTPPPVTEETPAG